MNYQNISILLILTLIFSACTAKSKGFFEDIYSQTEVRSAAKGDYVTVQSKKETIIQESTRTKSIETNNQINSTSQIYKAKGKILESNYDKDVELFVYVFLENGQENPIIFYYNRDLKSTGKKVNIIVKENFLTHISEDGKTKNQRTEKKREKSTIKAPIVEKINTL